ncbi:helix-turn-helix domain-containing protein [Microbacterium sp. Leaf151]|uniref:helix-turn-helix domain-containing protein n=1 Tax=Microbacterium sp. Leaf151 TaxID=1736276 RepID=UPI001910D65F
MPNRRRREQSKYLQQAEQLSKLLRECREGAGLSQEAVARKADLSVNTVRNVESGRAVEPGYFTVLAIAHAVGAELARAGFNVEPR